MNQSERVLHSTGYAFSAYVKTATMRTFSRKMEKERWGGKSGEKEIRCFFAPLSFEMIVLKFIRKRHETAI